MDFKSLKDVNNLKALLKGMGADIAGAFTGLKGLNGEKFKQAFNTYYVELLQNNYADFKGRTSRRQYWMFILFNVMVSFVLGFIGGLIPFLSIFSVIYAFAILVPAVALGIRRLHDLDLSGWFMLIAFIPVLGSLAMLFLFLMPGDKESNKFGSANK